MSKGTKKRKNIEAQNQTVFPIKEFVRAQLFSFVVSLGIDQLYKILEDERRELCGDRYRHNTDRTAVRAGHVKGTLAMGGRQVSLSRPRVRSVKGNSEIPLQAWEQFRDADPLSQRVMEQMILGVSTRKYDRSLEEAPEDLKTRGTSKSAVSRRFIQGTQKKLDELTGRDLSPYSFAVIMIDGVHFADHVLLVALGFTETGEKVVLGLHEGATENSRSCKALLRSIIDRGVSSDCAMVFSIDGSKALKKAITDTWGDLAIIQRCRVHKQRNVTEHLPKSMQATVQQSMRQAYKMRDAVKAKRLLLNLAAKLENDYPGAAGSLREGLEETLSVNAMGLPVELERALVVTNAIENLFSSIRTISGRVKRWTGGKMVLRWSAAGLLEAEKKFRRIRGYKHMNRLIEALKNHEKKLGYGARIDSVKQTG
jgi:transposase-like protein